MHSITLLMKVHSYLAVNREMKVNSLHLIDLRTAHDNLIGENKKNDEEVSFVTSSMESLSEDGEPLTPIQLLSEEIRELETDLANGSTKYPANVTFANFLDFLFLPTLVYELEYPRTSVIRVGYLLEKIAGTAGVCFCMYLTIQHHILPFIRDIPNLEFLVGHFCDNVQDIFFNLLFPFLLCWFMLFYIIFEGICNGFAEIMKYADRDFYDDWWNSVNFEEFARKWNKPVHEFLLRHIYLEGIRNYKLSKRDATFVTFLMSSLLHECVLLVVGKRIRPYFILFRIYFCL